MVRRLPFTSINPPSREVVPAALVVNPPLYFPHNWSEPFGVRTDWSTDVVSSFYSGWEETTGSSMRPVRTIAAAHSGGDARMDFLRQYVLGLTPKNPDFPTDLTWQTYGYPREVQVGLDCDAAKVVGALNPTTAYGDWGFRRIYVGQRVFVERADRGIITVGNKRILAASAVVTYVDRTLLAVSGLPFPFEAGMKVIPALDCSAVDSVSIQDITGRISSAEVEGVEALGASQLPPIYHFKQVLPLVQTYGGLPVLTVDHNWQAAASQVVIRARSGDRAVALHGPSSRRGIRVSGSALGRQAWFDALSMFDAMQGQAGRFWAVLPSIIAGSQNPATRLAPTRYRIPEYGSFDDWLSMHKALAFEDADTGAPILARIVGSQAQWEVTLSDPIPERVTRCVKWAALCRFGDDSFEEEWVSTDVGNFSYTIYEATDSSSTGMV